MTSSIRKGLLALALACAACLLAAKAPHAIAQNSGAQSSGTQGTAPAAVLATSSRPAEVLRRADQLTNIRAQGSTPFHLKAHFVATGPVEFTGEGDYEETWLAPDKWVEEIHFGPYHSIETRDGAKHTFQANQLYRPKRVLQAASLLTYKRPENDPALQWALQSDKVSGIIQLVPPLGALSIPSTLSFNPDGTPAQDRQCMWLGYAEFSGKRVARILQENSSLAEPLLKINVIQLDALPASAALPEVSLPNPVVTSDSGSFEVGKDSVTAPKLLKGDLKYPGSLRKTHPEGLVVVSLMVDINGGAREAEAVFATNALFIPAAIKAVSRYKFEPARLNGIPVQVRVNVEANFKVY